jgi:hypothetical protein
MPVIVSPALPLPAPEKGSPEWITRYVRHGMADVLEWVGEEVGRGPDDTTDVLVMAGQLVMSQAAYDRIRTVSA